MTLQEVTSFITPICTVLVAYFTYRNGKKVDDNTKITKENGAAIQEVKVQTDGINSKLVSTTRELALEQGNRIGRADLKTETESLLHDPIKVEIVNEPIKVAPVEQHPDTKT